MKFLRSKYKEYIPVNYCMKYDNDLRQMQRREYYGTN